MRIRLTALDTLFFRDGKPFDKNEETWANGVFPPPPSVFYGALRSLYFTSYPEHLGKENTKEDPTRYLVINDIQVTSDDNLYYPCPLDVVIKKDAENKSENYLLLDLVKSDSITSSVLDYRLHIRGNIEIEPITGYVNKRSFERKYLKGELPNQVFPIDDFLTQEPKVGIGRNNFSHVSEEGLLYRVGMVRPRGKKEENILNIEIDFELNDWDLKVGEKGFLKIGAEGKSCSFEVVPTKEAKKFQATGSDIIKIYFVTPTLFSNDHQKEKEGKSTNIQGWLPSFIKKNLEGEWNGIKLKFLAAAIGKPKYLGGFDIKNRKPKPMVKMIPEGSVYYFQLLDGNDREKLEMLQQPFSLIDEDIEKNNLDMKELNKKTITRKMQGFGLAYFANVRTP